MADEFSTGPDIRNAFRETPDFKPNGHYHNGHDKTPWREKEPPWIHEREPIERINWTELQDLTAPPQEWIVPGWVPCGETTLLGGPGGHGKTLLAQQMCTGLVLGREWMGIELKETPTYLVLCEDKHNDAWRRQENINRYYGCTMPDLWSMATTVRRRNTHNRLMIFDRDGVGHLTTLYDQLLEDIKNWGAKFVILDTLADLFLGDLNNADHARAFIRQCTDPIADAIEGGVVLIYHPSRTGIREGTGEYGSVQWDAAARSRLYHARLEPTEEGEYVDPNLRVLTRKKSNFAEPDATIDMRWDEGVLIRTSPLSGIDRKAQQSKADRVFDKLRDRYAQQHRGLSVSPGTIYLPALFAADPDSEGVSKIEFRDAMNRAFKAGKITVDPETKKIVSVVNGN